MDLGADGVNRRRVGDGLGTGWGRIRCGDSYSFAVGVVKGLELDNVGVTDDAHDLEFTVLLG